MTFAAQTVRQVLERARMAHWALSSGPQMPDGAALLLVNEQQRETLLTLIEQIEPLIGETQQVAIGNVAGALVALDDNDVPYYTTTVEDGYAIRFDGNGVPYIDTSEPYVLDPFGAGGIGTPGFPLPEDMLRLIACTVVFITDQQFDPPHTVQVLDQRPATMAGYGRGLKAFVSARRLVPVRQVATDAWSDVTALNLAWVRCPVLDSLDDELTLPDPLMTVLRARLTQFLATASPNVSEQDRQRFERELAKAEFTASNNGIKILESVTEQSVIYRG